MEVCSLYMYDPRRRRCACWRPRAWTRRRSGGVAMAVDEGLTGIVVQKDEPVMAIDAMAHPRYKYFPETGEERFHSFLGVPIVGPARTTGRVGHPDLGRRRRLRPRRCACSRRSPCQWPASWRSGGCGQSRTQGKGAAVVRGAHVGRPDRLRDLRRRTGRAARRPGAVARLGASPGSRADAAHLLAAEVRIDDLPRERTAPVKREVARLHAASAARLTSWRARAIASPPACPRSTPPSSTRSNSCCRTRTSRRASRPSFARAADRGGGAASGRRAERPIRRVGRCVYEGPRRGYSRHRPSACCAVAGVSERRRPSATTVYWSPANWPYRTRAARSPGAESGGVGQWRVTSHARFWPSRSKFRRVVRCRACPRNDPGRRSAARPTATPVSCSSTPARRSSRVRGGWIASTAPSTASSGVCATSRRNADGHRVTLSANVGPARDLALHACTVPKGGIVPYRSAFLSHRDFLTRNEQVALYCRMVRGMQGRPITIRTLDLGLTSTPVSQGSAGGQPVPRWRSIRISLELPEVFKVQLRAILRAQCRGPGAHPVSDDLERRGNPAGQRAARRGPGGAAGRGQPFDPYPPIGMMVEVPSAVCLAPS